MAKSRSEYIMFHPASFLNGTLQCIASSDNDGNSIAKFHRSLITIMLNAFHTNAFMWYVVMYLRSGGTHNVLSVETDFLFGDNKIHQFILQCIYIIKLKED